MSEDFVQLTEEGCCLPDLAPQAYYGVSYLPTFAAVPSLLRGDKVSKILPQLNGDESHLDRLYHH